MADDDGDAVDDPPIGGSPTRPSMTGHRVLEMDALGWFIFIALLLILLPLLPILLVIVILYRLLGLGGRRAISWRGAVGR